ncbi:MAG: O-antigen ligase family protein [Syntrophorhabdus sp.]|jgi:O-antigen ligase|nr:O-antigen ligase family protein [Syntrophorhabdus sp.]OPX95337.1 MAG: O-Antigen ligase [Syntrophorhabdus sp. PtaB.Bin027]
MPPQLALFLCLLFIGYIFWIDIKTKDGPSHELWIPLIWMFLAGSRYVSQWLNWSPSQLEAYHEGSPLDAIVFTLLIVGGLYVLSRRKIDWNLLVRQNKWIWLYFLYCGVSIVWSDFPFVSFKRWIKELGNPIMVLVILTDRRPVEAIDSILRRLAVAWLPLSIVFFKYFPTLGRQFHESTGELYATGVGQQKNSLGMLCLICGIYFSWKYLLKYKNKFRWNWQENIADLILMVLTVWLLNLSKSATAIVCLVVVVFLLLASRVEMFVKRPRNIITFLVVFIPVFFLLEVTFSLTDLVLDLLGRDRSLTTRVPIWVFLMGMVTNPIMGAGYYSFWMGERLQVIWGFTGRTINQAHNGYLEQYLNLGYIGLFFTGAIILAGLLKVRRQLIVDYPLGMLSLCFIVSALLYNYTEASFYGINNMWLLLLFGITEANSQKHFVNETTKLDAANGIKQTA